MTVQEWEFSGPTPPPAVLEGYEAVAPGSAALIFKNFDEQGAHRRTLEQRVVSGSEVRANRGQFIGAFLVTLGILCGLIIALSVDPVAGAGVIVGSLGSAAIVYVVGGRPPKPGRPPE